MGKNGQNQIGIVERNILSYFWHKTMTTTKKIMIVDDDQSDIDFFCEAVNEIDVITFVTATKGEDALHRLRQTIKVLPD
jgi:hypothetical protein